jgi:hypothetical protein
MWNGVQRAVTYWNSRGSSELMEMVTMAKVAPKTCILPLFFFTEGLFVLGTTAPRAPRPPQLRGF